MDISFSFARHKDRGESRINSKPLTILDANGWLKTMTYDAARRQTGIKYGDGTAVTYGYDAVSNRTTMVDSTGTTSYAYSPRHELIGKTDPGGLVQSYNFDSASNRTKLVDPDGGIFTYTYDAVNRQVTQQVPSGEKFTMGYDADGRNSTIIQALGGYEIQTSDALNRSATEISYNVASSPITTVVDTYDPAGRKTKQVRDSLITTYSYDNGDRLTAQAGNTPPSGTSESLTMDELGNVTYKTNQTGVGVTSTSFVYDAASRLESTSTSGVLTAYTYDNNGNMTAEGSSINNTYDRENRLSVIMNGIDPTTLTYDGTGLRRSKQWVQSGATKTTTYVWDGTDYLSEYTY